MNKSLAEILRLPYELSLGHFKDHIFRPNLWMRERRLAVNWNGRIAIIGSGVAGSFLAWLLRDSEVRVTLFEQRRLYDKPCGEAVPADVISLIDKDVISKFIRHKIRVVYLYIKCGGWYHKAADFNKTVGFILDKRKFIMHLRQEAMKGDAVNIK